MKRKLNIWLPVIVALLLLLAVLAVTVPLKYDLRLGEYLRYSLPLTAAEKQYLAEKETIICGLDQGAPPLSYVEAQTGQQVGLIPDYMSSLSIELGVAVQYQPLVWSEVLTSLREGTIDTADLFASNERQEWFAFSQPIYVLRGSLAVSRDNPEIAEFTDLAGKRVAVSAGDYIEEYLLAASETWAKPPQLVTVDGIAEAVELLLAEEVEAVAGDETVIHHVLMSGDHLGAVQILATVLYEEDVTFATARGEDTLLSILNKGILRLKKKDILTKTQEKWFGVSAPIIKNHSRYDLFFRFFLVGLVAVTGFYCWNAVMRRKIKEKTREIEAGKSNLRTIIDALHVYLLVVNKELEILECNALTEQLLGAPRENILRSSLTAYPLLNRLYARGQDTGPHRIQERYYSVVARPLIPEGKALAGETKLLTIEDVTDRVQTDRRISQQSKMIAVGQLSAGLAHEIRNPLGLIRNYLYILRRFAKDENGEHAVNVVGESVNRINQLIENLLSFSRLSSDEAQTVSLRQFIEGILLLEEKKIADQGITIQVECAPDLQVKVRVEALKLVLLNLVENAVNAFAAQTPPAADTPPPGAGTLPLPVPDESRRLSIVARCAAPADLLQIEVADNAGGIAEGQLEQIFNPFYTTRDGGTGLGLYIVSTELDKLGGTIAADSRIGEGTVLRLTIPLESAAEKGGASHGERK